MNKKKNIFLLIGRKGSGKSFIGMLFEKHFQIGFIRVEDWAKDIKKERSVDNEAYIKEVFATIEEGMRNSLQTVEHIVFESTGLTDYFDAMLSSLQMDFRVVTIKVHADEELCVHRVQNRDQSIHINVSDEQVRNINKAVGAKKINTEFVIDNSHKTVEELKEEVRAIIQEVSSSIS